MTRRWDQLAMPFAHRPARGDRPEFVAPGYMRLRVKRSAWQSHRRACLDARGLALANVWLPDGPHRVAVCDRGLGVEVGRQLEALGVAVEVLDGGAL